MIENKVNIEYINIIGLFNERDVMIDLKNLVNIFVGVNGCGKTTTLKILKGIFTDNLLSIYNIDFKELHIKFKNEDVVRIKKEDFFNSDLGKDNGISNLKKLLNKYKTKEKVLFLSDYRQPEFDFVIEDLEVEKDVEDFIKICENFLHNKTLKTKKYMSKILNSKKIEIEILDKDNLLKDNELSKGEKEILSLFSKLYFKGKKDIILLIDEPENSLSINWQKELIPSIVKSGKCSLIVTMTHSPFIFQNEFFETCTRELC